MNEPMISYAHKNDPNGTRFVQLKKDQIPDWAVDIREYTSPEQTSRCYGEQQDYTLEELGNDAWLTGCPLCGGTCWDISDEQKERIDKLMADEK